MIYIVTYALKSCFLNLNQCASCLVISICYQLINSVSLCSFSGYYRQQRSADGGLPVYSGAPRVAKPQIAPQDGGKFGV